MVVDPVMAKTVQINTISRYHAAVYRGGMGLGAKKLCHHDDKDQDDEVDDEVDGDGFLLDDEKTRCVLKVSVRAGRLT